METNAAKLYSLTVYGLAWKMLHDRISSSRKQHFTKADLIEFRLKAIETAIDKLKVDLHGKQEEA